MSHANMNCPVCSVALTMSERQGIEIDYCPQCRGVWLDRGELDKIIERSAEAAPPPPASAAPPPPPQQPGYAQPVYVQPGYPPQQHGYGYGHKPYKKHKSFLSELFD